MVMNTYNTSYPVKIVSRSASIARLRKARLSWLAAGLAFAVGCASALTPVGNEAIVASNKSMMVITDEIAKKLESIVSAAPEYAENTSAPSANTVAAPLVKYPLTFELKAKKGDNLIGMLKDAGVSSNEAHEAFDTVKTVFNPRKLTAGMTFALKLDKNADGDVVISSLKFPASTISNIELSRADNDSFDIKKIDVPLTKKLARAGGSINGSIYQTGENAGIPASMLSEIINAYSYDVDFQRDVKKGDAIDVLFERMETSEGKVAGNGNLVFAELQLGDRTLKLYRYTDKNGNADFYNEKGESVRKALLRTPINGARVTSGFGLREHPISGYTKMHKGVDFGAATGTPVYAAGDGVVEIVRRENGYGNYLRIKHNNKYSSAYAHLSRYASGMVAGKRVKQGQIVAYVGSTGASTGPHLHYEILAGGEQVNPANVKFKTGNVLAGKELANFKANMGKIEARLASIARGKTVAMVETDKQAVVN